MSNPHEAGLERIPDKREVLDTIARFAENVEDANIVTERYDDAGLAVFEVEIPGGQPDETIQYEYMRKGRVEGVGGALSAKIYKMYYSDGMPIGGEEIARINPETGGWDQNLIPTTPSEESK